MLALAHHSVWNPEVTARIESGSPDMPPGIPKNYPDARKLVTEDSIEPG